jgi:4-amino-4-deoxy-L-arabinose transferase-like glycosyltransferase
MLAPMSAFLGQQAGFSRKVCIRTAICISLYPILLLYPVGLASENLYIPLGLLSIILIYRSTKKNVLKWVILAGLACGLTMLTRSIFAFSTLFAGIWIGIFSPLRRKAGLLFLIVAFGICLPWSIRNSIIMKQPAFVENSAGYNLFIGYHPEGDGGFVSTLRSFPCPYWMMVKGIQIVCNRPSNSFARIQWNAIHRI